MTTTNLKPKLSIRMLARREGTTWKKVAQDKALDLIQGTISEPQWANQTVTFAFVYVLADSTPRRLSHVTTSLWQFDQHGRVDDREAMISILQQLEVPVAKRDRDAAQQMSEGDLQEICRLLNVLSSD